MKIVSVLGGSGWLGKPLSKSLLEEDYDVKVSTRTESKLKDLEDQGFDPYLVDIEDYEEFDLFLESDILLIMITSKDVDGFHRLIEQIENSTITKVLFVSSTSVYPNSNSVVTEENQTLESDLSNIENLFFSNPLFETTILRFAGLFGDGRHPGRWFQNGRKIPRPEGFVNMIHQEDCIEIIHEIIGRDSWGQIFNACSNDHPTRREYYVKAKKSLGLDAPIFVENQDSDYKIINSDKLQTMLEYSFIHDNLLNFSSTIFETKLV